MRPARRLANPSYAGVYVFGRYQSAKQVSPSGEVITRLRPMPQDSWRVVIRDHHEGYISWDQFVGNRHRLAANRTNAEGLPGPAGSVTARAGALVARSEVS